MRCEFTDYEGDAIKRCCRTGRVIRRRAIITRHHQERQQLRRYAGMLPLRFRS
jgi:hypothetical protein